MKIKNQIYLINFFSSIIPLILLGILTFVTLEKELRHSEEEKIELTLKKGEFYLESIFNETESELNILSHIYKKSSKGDFLEKMKLFSNENKNIKYFAYGDTKGNFYIGNDYSEDDFNEYDPRKRPWYTGALLTDGYYISELFRHVVTNELILTISKKVELNNKVLGVIVARINIDSLKKLYKELNTLNEIYLIDLEGNLIVDLNDSGVEYIKVKNSFSKIKGEENSELIINNKKMLYHIHDMKNISAFLVGGISEDDFISPLRRIEKIITLIIVGAILSIVLLTILFSRSFSKSLYRLSHIIDNIARGNYDKNISKLNDFIDVKSELFLVKEAIKKMQDEIKEREIKLKMISEIDSLTGILNRGAIMDLIDMEIKRSKNFGTEFSLIMFDLDHFKSLNDNYGHQFGDEVLERIAKLTLDNIKSEDSFGRYGGEEFLLLLSDANERVGVGIANRIKNKIMSLEWTNGSKVTASFGVIHCIGYEEDSKALFKKVDRLLYKAKENGRNRVEF